MRKQIILRVEENVDGTLFSLITTTNGDESCSYTIGDDELTSFLKLIHYKIKPNNNSPISKIIYNNHRLFAELLARVAED